MTQRVLITAGAGGVAIDNGSCCLTDSCIDNITALDCREAGGIFANGVLCADRKDCPTIDPPALGSCCTTEEECIDGTTAIECRNVNGSFVEGVPCDERKDCRTYFYAGSSAGDR